jgi:hypothetical protein
MRQVDALSFWAKLRRVKTEGELLDEFGYLARFVRVAVEGNIVR